MAHEWGAADISSEVFGKYQNCSKGPDGLWYANCDFPRGGFGEKPVRGALPNPNMQDTPEQRAIAREAHRRAADRLATDTLGVTQPTQRRRWWQFWRAEQGPQR